MTLPIDARAGAVQIPRTESSTPFPSGPTPTRIVPESGAFREHLARAAVHLAEGDAAMNVSMRQAMRGEGLDQAQLIALQSGVYRYSQEMELASRLVDRATQAVKQTLQSQS